MKYESVDPEFVQSMLRSLYVDDLDGGKNDLDAAFEFYLKAKVRFLEGGFNLKKWLSNSPALMKLIEANEHLPKDDINKSDLLYEDDETYAKTYLGQSELPMSNDQQSKVLGLSCDNINDCLLFNLYWLIQYARELPLTKRSVLKVAAKLYDPLGIISLIFLPVKLIFQELCKWKVDWDEPLNEEMKGKFLTWISSLETEEPISVNRCYFEINPENIESLQLHAFGDSSEMAYAGVIYLRIETNETVLTQLIMSKTRVAPLEPMSVPRLGLLASLISSRLVTHVKSALSPVVNIGEIYCWSDSTTTLHRIKGIQ